MSGKARVLVIALDAADPGLVRELAAAGDMPTMARLLDQAAVVGTLAPPGVFVSANWPTIYTATMPDRHRYLCWEEIRGGTYERHSTSPTMVRGTPIWTRISEAGRRVAVLDVPHSVTERVNGAMLVEWGCHDRHHGPSSWPPELAGELSASHGMHFGTAEPPGFDQFAPCDYILRAGTHRTAQESVALFEAICEGAERKRDVSLDLLDRGDWDFFLTVLGEAHCVGHQLWHAHDRTHPAYDPDLVRRLGGDPVREVYRRLDGVIGEHLERLAPEDTAYVLLPHGMTAHYDGTHLLDHLLHRLEVGLDEPAAFGKPTRAAAMLSRLVPRPLRRRALRLLAPLVRARTRAAGADAPPPPEHRRWFQVPNNTVVGAVRLNVEGREPEGRVHPDDARRVLGWIADRLGELVNLDTGGPVVRRCELVDDVYHRTPDDAFGDLFVEWERSAPIERVWSPATGTVAIPYEHWRQGDHIREGLLLAKGPGIRAGRRRSAFKTADVGATFAAAAGVSLPDADGEPIDSILPAGIPRRRAGWGILTLAKVRSRLGAAFYRRERGRVPAWAGYRNHGADRLRRDTRAEAAAAAEREAEQSGRISELEHKEQIVPMSAWLPHASVSEELLISVVMPTRNRRRLLESAIGSVMAQAYGRWELLVVDDGSSDDTADFLTSIDDPRLRTLEGPGKGACAARNLALEAARGDVIAYLDDDNLFDPQWLKAAALTFIGLPDTIFCYGARVFDDDGRVRSGESNARAGIQFVRWDPKAIREYNFIDINVLAHRRDGLRFDEALMHLGDWDLVLRLARKADPVEVPAIAAYYRTDAPDRLTTMLSSEEHDQEHEAVRKKLVEAAAD